MEAAWKKKQADELAAKIAKTQADANAAMAAATKTAAAATKTAAAANGECNTNKDCPHPDEACFEVAKNRYFSSDKDTCNGYKGGCHCKNHKKK